MDTHIGSANKKTLRVAIIGLGNQSLNDHIPALLRRNDVLITEICDLNESSIELFFQKYTNISNSIRVYQNVFDMHLNVDFCIVSLPHNQYFEIIKYLIIKKIPFIKEKPLSRNRSEMQEILSLPDIHKYCFTCSQRRYNPLYKKALEAKNEIGKAYLFNAIYKLKVLDPHTGWRGNKELAGGGCLMDMGYHIIDQLLWWFGEPDDIFVTTSNMAIENGGDYAEDTSLISFKYKEGLHGSIVLSRSAGEKKEEYALVGSKGQLSGTKRSLVLQNKEGSVLWDSRIEDDAPMMDGQLEFFINRIREGKDFKDIIVQHKKNMEFIDRCYEFALVK